MRINCDVAEGFSANDSVIIPLVDDVNIACGGHAGDEETMRITAQMAARAGARIFAHPGYPDRENFGRKSIRIELDTLRAEIVTQWRLLKKVCSEEETAVSGIKLHGALYHDAIRSPATLDAILSEFTGDESEGLKWVLPAGQSSKLAAIRVSESGFRPGFEVFADRRYDSEGHILPRSDARAILSTVDEVYRQLTLLLDKSSIVTVDGKLLELEADTICIHGDHGPSVKAMKRLREVG